MPRSNNLPESGTVTVACNHVGGLVLRLDEMVEHDDPVLGGGTKTVKVADALQFVRLNGPAVPHGVTPSFRIIGGSRNADGTPGRDGYALTSGVDAQFFRAWMEQHKNDDVVKNRVVYADEKSAETAAWAKDNKDARSGLEPLNPKGDPRRPKSQNPNVKGIEMADMEAA